GQFQLVLPFFDVGPIDLLDVVVIENSLEWLDRAETTFDLIQQVFFEHSGVRSRSVHVVFEDVPACEYKVVESSERYKILHFRRTAIGTLAQANRAHLRQRSDWRSNSLPHGLDTSDKRGRDRTHSGDHDTEFALGGLNARVLCPAFLHFGARRFTAI